MNCINLKCPSCGTYKVELTSSFQMRKLRLRGLNTPAQFPPDSLGGFLSLLCRPLVQRWALGLGSLGGASGSPEQCCHLALW